MHILLEVASR